MTTPTKKQRLDHLVAARGLADSVSQANNLIRAGKVSVDGQVASKPGHAFAADVDIAVKAPPRFVGRGGEKLQGALEDFGVDVAGRVCLDIGASTGGFTDCLLQNGAERVYAVDVGKGQLHWRLRNDPRVVVMESVNARRLEPDAIPEPASLAVIDVSFISLTLVLPPVIRAVESGGGVIALIKPQFEAGPADVGKGGIVRDPKVREAVVSRIRAFADDTLGLTCIGVRESRLPGADGNVESLAYWTKE